VTTFTATWQGKTYTRTSNRTYTHASVVRWSDGTEAVVSWHGTEKAALKGALTGHQKQGGARVITAIPVTTPAAGTPVDVEHTERGTEVISPTGRVYFVNDFDGDSQGNDFLWLLPVDRKTNRRRRLYQRDVDQDGWTVKQPEAAPAAEPDAAELADMLRESSPETRPMAAEPAAPTYQVQRWSPATGNWLVCGGNLRTAMTLPEADSYADLLRESSPEISYRVVETPPTAAAVEAAVEEIRDAYRETGDLHKALARMWVNSGHNTALMEAAYAKYRETHQPTEGQGPENTDAGTGHGDYEFRSGH
jgi:hypothetical protein